MFFLSDKNSVVDFFSSAIIAIAKELEVDTT